jgi:LysR family hydrogen peroxide-inducible transcriptional activator
MELHQLRYFVAVAETHSFSRAAQRCHVAQPSLSQQVRKLESSLGHRLFDRLPRGAMLTDAGQALLPRARRILAEVNEVSVGIAADIDSGSGPLRVGAIPTMAPYLLPPLVRRFSRKFPECELTLREDLTERLIEALTDHTLDLAIVSTPIDDPAVRLEVVGAERLLLVTSATESIGSGRSSAGVPRDWENAPAVVLHEMHCLGQQIESFCSYKRLRRRIVCQSTQLSTVLDLVALGLGISIVPEMCARADQSNTRRYHDLGRDGPCRDIAVAAHADSTPSTLSRTLVEMLRENLSRGRHGQKNASARRRD